MIVTIIDQISQIGSRKILSTVVNAHICSDILYAFSMCSGEISNKCNKFWVTSMNCTVQFPALSPNTWQFLYIVMVSRASGPFAVIIFYWYKRNSLIDFNFSMSVFLLGWSFTFKTTCKLFLFRFLFPKQLFWWSVIQYLGNHT